MAIQSVALIESRKMATEEKFPLFFSKPGNSFIGKKAGDISTQGGLEDGSHVTSTADEKSGPGI